MPSLCNSHRPEQLSAVAPLAHSLLARTGRVALTLAPHDSRAVYGPAPETRPWWASARSRSQ
jgi:hypothetical protein